MKEAKSVSARESPCFQKTPAHTQRENNEEEVARLRKFSSQFLSMASLYLKEEWRGQSEGKRLKKGWKWIKEVVREWDEGREELSRMQKFVEQAEGMLELPPTGEMEPILDTIEMLSRIDQ